MYCEQSLKAPVVTHNRRRCVDCGRLGDDDRPSVMEYDGLGDASETAKNSNSKAFRAGALGSV